MKKLFTSIFIFAAPLIWLASSAQTYVSGFISQNTSWNLAGSPYIVTGNALLSHGYTLTVDPGVIVKFNSACALQIDGQLVAIGTPQNKITFTSNLAIPAPGDWANLHFSDSSSNAVFDTAGNYVSGSIMKYCSVRFGGTTPYGCVQMGSSSPYFNHCLVSNSASCGIYSNGSAFRFDSSVVEHCADYGLWFYHTYINSCGLSVIGDTIQFNRGGGMLIDGTPGCTTNVRNNYFIGNGKHGAIKTNLPVNDFHITGNTFYQDSATQINDGIISIDNFGTTSNHVISDNYFISNYKSDIGYLLMEKLSDGYDSITCNVFVGNTVANSAGGLLLAEISGTQVAYTVIDKNYFENNSLLSAFSSLAEISNIASHKPLFFGNNTIRNNIGLNTQPLFRFVCYLTSANPLTFIHDNNFTGNTSLATIRISGNNMTGTNYIPVDITRNNFSNPASAYELYNMIPFGSPNLYPDSNYWGSMNPQHVDSVIYDYFDQSGLSVMYYSPIANSAFEVDSVCVGAINTSISDADAEQGQLVYPNPFSQTATIHFTREVNNGVLQVYNMYGQCVRTGESISSDEIIIDRGNLAGGIYFFTVTENSETSFSGKLVIEQH